MEMLRTRNCATHDFPRRLKRNLGAAVAAVLCASAPVADSQELLPEKSVSVKDRPRPEYDALGIRVGLLHFSPRVSLGESYDDNIFSTKSDKISDLITTLAADASLQSDGRIPWSVFGGVTSGRYADYSSENYSDWRGGLSLEQDFGSRTTASLRGSFARNHESRGDPSFPDAATEPSSFNTRRADLEITRMLGIGRLKLLADIETTDYSDATLAGGALLDQDFRDRKVWDLDLRTDFSIGPRTAVFVRLAHKQQQYESSDAGFDRDASTDAIYGGAAVWISNLVRGDLGIGVMEVDNSDPGQEDQRSLALTCNLEFYLTQLLTATLQAQRGSGASDIEGSATYVSTSTGVQLDYELRRNVILAANFSYLRREYSGINLADTSDRSAITAQWLWSRHMRLNLKFELEDRDYAFETTGRSYAQKVFSAGVALAW